MTTLLDRPFGIYEKALCEAGWDTVLSQARAAGFDFVEMSIDESDRRISRLSWSKPERDRVLRSSRDLEMPIYSMCLSVHRRFGLGSSQPEVRVRAAQILDEAIGLACDLGIRVIQIAGYFNFYEKTDPEARNRYVQGLAAGVEVACRRGVMLAIENIDTSDMESISDCIALRDELDSPWFQIYPDVGNLAVHRLDVVDQLRHLDNAAVGLHLKDARPGEPRRVPFGTGTVPFEEIFENLADASFAGPFTVEMWNDNNADAVKSSAAALCWLKDCIRAAVRVHAGGATQD